MHINEIVKAYADKYKTGSCFDTSTEFYNNEVFFY